MKMYFQHSDGVLELIKEVEFIEDFHMRDILDDLHKRNPNFKSYYQREWLDDDGNFWIDVGSHTEFYVIKPD